MDALHRAYVVFTEEWGLAHVVMIFVVPFLIAPRQVPLSLAMVVLVLGVVLSIGWMMLDAAFYPGSHNLLPIEAVFKLVLVLPMALAVGYKLRRQKHPRPDSPCR